MTEFPEQIPPSPPTKESPQDSPYYVHLLPGDKANVQRRDGGIQNWTVAYQREDIVSLNGEEAGRPINKTLSREIIDELYFQPGDGVFVERNDPKGLREEGGWSVVQVKDGLVTVSKSISEKDELRKDVPIPQLMQLNVLRRRFAGAKKLEIITGSCRFLSKLTDTDGTIIDMNSQANLIDQIAQERDKSKKQTMLQEITNRYGIREKVSSLVSAEDRT